MTNLNYAGSSALLSAFLRAGRALRTSGIGAALRRQVALTAEIGNETGTRPHNARRGPRRSAAVSGSPQNLEKGASGRRTRDVFGNTVSRIPRYVANQIAYAPKSSTKRPNDGGGRTRSDGARRHCGDVRRRHGGLRHGMP